MKHIRGHQPHRVHAACKLYIRCLQRVTPRNAVHHENVELLVSGLTQRNYMRLGASCAQSSVLDDENHLGIARPRVFRQNLDFRVYDENSLFHGTLIYLELPPTNFLAPLAVMAGSAIKNPSNLCWFHRKRLVGSRTILD